MTFISLLSLLCLTMTATSQPFSPSEMNQMRGYFENNIGVSGCYTGFVVAAPSHSQPDYYYHWQRDAAISMFALQQTATSSSDYDGRFKNYVTFVEHAYNEGGLGEPKYYCNGSVYGGKWCRPQDDGPALTAKALAAYATYLINNGQKSYVTQHLYSISNGSQPSCSVPDSAKKNCGQVGTNQQQCEASGCCWDPAGSGSETPWCFYKGSGGAGGLIPRALDFVQDNWQSANSCDLWEEVRGLHFFTLMVQRKGLLSGAILAKALGDSARASSYANTAQSMVSTIRGFQKGNIIVDSPRENDCSVAVGSLYGGTGDLFGPTDKTILNTINVDRSYFQKVFPINAQDSANGIPGTLIGRYANDQYNGCEGANAGTNQGHAWILCTNAYADIYYHNSMAIQEHIVRGDVHAFLDEERLNIYAETLQHDQPKMSNRTREYAKKWVGLDLREKEEFARHVASALASEGDGMLTRVKYHANGCDLHLTEQLCETNGFMVGAPDLTWSYGTVLQAMYTRSHMIGLGVKPRPFEKTGVKKGVGIVSRLLNPFQPQQKACHNCEAQC